MAKRAFNNVKLGLFVTGGLLFLVILLYMIGRNKSLFGANYTLKARFDNAQGLVAGNNVRFAGIQTGTVKKIRILSDTVIEISMVIDKKMSSVIRSNAVASIGSEGLVGNKVINITPCREPAPLAEEGHVLASKKSLNTDEMLLTLSKTNNDIAFIAEQLKVTVQKVNSSSALWQLLNDPSIPADVRAAAGNIREATGRANAMANDLRVIVLDVKKGKGSLGTLLKDTAIAKNLDAAILKIQVVGERAGTAAAELSHLLAGIAQDINSSGGVVNAILKDTAVTAKLNASLGNIEKATDGFNQNMEALKHNFLLRGYFKKMERRKSKAAQKQLAKQE
jgi:phospholipid/cholesterol/gamma-HCH transport system substrate-binding protein